MFELNEELVCKVRDTVNAGLVKGLGKPEPGKMCVEAAVCYAMGLPHSDQPTCVGRAVRAYKIRINDAKWSSNEARTAGLLKLAIAQLGSDTIDQRKFVKIVAEQTIRKTVPMALRAAKIRNPKHAEQLEVAAANCESEGTAASARQARAVAYAVYAYAYDDTGTDIDTAAAAADTAAVAAYAYAYAYADTDAAAAAFAYVDTDAAAAAAAYADTGGAAARDSVLNVACQIALDALIELKSPGCAFLYLVEG
jgi:hypothetical protein